MIGFTIWQTALSLLTASAPSGSPLVFARYWFAVSDVGFVYNSRCDVRSITQMISLDNTSSARIIIISLSTHFTLINFTG